MRPFVLAAVACAACATVGDLGDPAAPPAPSFTGVHRVALVRTTRPGGGARPKDPLDGLEESLRARGFATRVVDLSGRVPGELRPVERLVAALDARASVRRRTSTAAPAVGADAAAAAADALGVDAIATYHRFDLLLPPPPEPAAVPGALIGSAEPVPDTRPDGALTLVDRAGAVGVFSWGGAGPLGEPGQPVNPADAIDQLVRALTGEPADE